MNLEKLRELRDEVKTRLGVYKSSELGLSANSHTDLQLSRMNYRIACQEFVNQLLDDEDGQRDA